MMKIIINNTNTNKTQQRFTVFITGKVRNIFLFFDLRKLVNTNNYCWVYLWKKIITVQQQRCRSNIFLCKYVTMATK